MKLEAAGADEVAQHLRIDIEREEKLAPDQLEQKLAQLASLQADVDKLRREARAVPQLLLKVKIVDIDVTQARKLGIEMKVSAAQQPGLKESFAKLGMTLVGPAPAAEPNPSVMVLPRPNALSAALEAMERQNLAVVKCAPNLMVYSGSPASFCAGGEFPITLVQNGMASTAMKRYGTEVDLSPVVQANGRVHVNIRARISDVDPLHSIETDGHTVPGLRSFEIATAFDACVGETLVLSTTSQQSNGGCSSCAVTGDATSAEDGCGADCARGAHEILRLVLVTPELVEAPGTASSHEPVATVEVEPIDRHDQMRAQRNQLLDKVDAPRNAQRR
jgi:Flp pilus assembly secretin CpaC